jgi:hypothetical protein
MEETLREALRRDDGFRQTTADRRTSRREDLITVVTATWLIAGLFLDGYAHQHLIAEGESFVTPWHSVFYAGFAATAAWVGRIVYRRPGRTLRERTPAGYWPAVLGLAGFAVGGIGDGLWHTLFGVEVGIDALLSPTHLVLMASLLAIVTAPYRAAIAEPSGRRRGVALVSLGIGTALTAFFLNFVWGLGDAGFTGAYDPASGSGERDVIAGVASALVSTGVLVGVTLFVLRLGRPGLGTFTTLFGIVSLAVHVAFEEEWIGVAAAAAAGAILDVLLCRVRSPLELKRALFISMGAMWTAYYTLAVLMDRMAWPAEIWIGSVVLCALAATGIVGVAGSNEVRSATPQAR